MKRMNRIRQVTEVEWKWFDEGEAKRNGEKVVNVKRKKWDGENQGKVGIHSSPSGTVGGDATQRPGYSQVWVVDHVLLGLPEYGSCT